MKPKLKMNRRAFLYGVAACAVTPTTIGYASRPPKQNVDSIREDIKRLDMSLDRGDSAHYYTFLGPFFDDSGTKTW